MNDVDWATAFRVFNLVTSMLLMAVLLIVVIWRFKRMDPVERLFSFALCGYVVYALGVTWTGLQIEIGFQWYTMVLAVSNVWMIATVIILGMRETESA